MPDRPSLRDRRRQETRSQISWAAVQLTVRRGLRQVTIEDIAAEAGVSPRTVNNYFPGKAEAIVARHHDRVLGIAEKLRARPADEPLWTAITKAALTRFAEDLNGAPEWVPDPQWIEGTRLMLAEPALQGAFLKAYAATEAALAEAVAERTGTDSSTDLYPVLVAIAAGGAIRATMQQWVRADPPGLFSTLLREAFAAVAGGLAHP
ncbi:TetR family transcriptional regulator [Amycolatopsis sp. PS_44_ISF1]|uniref:acyl-CoA-like ligand-binding transcription factor n=1 Tax=Amycolatopsis sp. PS_44_ISF1 TaxID=2974917 RepID=UPI0028DEC3E9|nr:TetR family transcriptional regulator [Amycolatopsis sp. PS_44_ISF1]MDT8911839.1 TetR family transcriptional regulator [Amycolatopsis sp. PS_44_ISF1]